MRRNRTVRRPIGREPILLKLRGGTSRIAEAIGVREDTARLWRSHLMDGAPRLWRRGHCQGQSAADRVVDLMTVVGA
jgi:hypothetical protein